MSEKYTSDSELERLLSLSNLDLDYYDGKHGVNWLAEMAAIVAGTKVSLVNLIDSYTQWSIAKVGLDITQMPREDSVCQYTMEKEEGEEFEVNDLSQDDRFKEKFYVKDDPNLTYYFGVPLTTSEGYNLGALCVMDVEAKQIASEKRELLKLIARQIVDRLKINSKLAELKSQMAEILQNQKKMAHDVRGPISGIVGLAEIIKMQGEENPMDEVLEYMDLIQKSGNSILDLADEILSQNFDSRLQMMREPKENELNLLIFKSKIMDLFAPQAMVKKLNFTVELGEENHFYPFRKSKLMQIVGNLISNSIKFTPAYGSVAVLLAMECTDKIQNLTIKVADTGTGIPQSKIDQILSSTATSEKGTSGEKGFGFGLNVVVKLVSEIGGELTIKSEEGNGTTFTINVPFNQ
ncbi:sensor histidine kinase [Algoriphagus pacificus]|uniref:histidine kinase n=1 Tax=Algoriphagus pacificus TaxID=2811234 RepID=A0ABS3CFI9_9BACT|nr:GAF domain-containing sensor histidine kinase [Algoriphagus pacificus]MBN7815872.1 GAF domain-containing sensor histidine kinase [Algoriphagus pacificus]